MVGFHKHDNMTTTQKLLAGCLSGVTTRFLTQPLDIIKLRTQVQGTKKGKKKKSIVKTARRIFFEEGYKAFWHGHVLGQVHSVLAVSSQFYVYEVLTQLCGDRDWSIHYRPYIRFFCGVAAGCASATLVLPLEVIRVRQMVVKEQYSSMLKGALAVYRYGGIRAFYEGLSASLLQPECEEPECEMSRSVNRYKPQNLLIASTVAGSLAGLISKTFTYPLDLTKRRLQLGSHRVSDDYKIPSTSQNLIRCNSLTDCLSKTVRKEGVRGLFRGWTVTIWKAQITSVVAFTSYELLCFSIREYNRG